MTANDNEPPYLAEDDAYRLTLIGCAFIVGCAAVMLLKAWLS